MRTLPFLFAGWLLLAPTFWAQADTPVTKVACTPADAAADLKPVGTRVRYDLNTGKNDEALALVNKWLAARPNDAALESLLGEVFYRRAEMGPAAEAFNTAIRLDPCNGRARYYAWRLDALTGKPGEAQRQLELAHQLAPTDPDILKTWTAEQQATALSASPKGPVVKDLKPLLLGFFAQTIDCDGIAVRASARVDPTALVLACGKVQRLLEHLPEVRKHMARAGAELHVIGEREMTSDMPENRRYQGAAAYRDAQGEDTNIDVRTRGVGGLMSSCGEENLLGLPGDRYWDGQDICTHEFSHDIMNIGFTDRQRSEIEQTWKAAIKLGLWKGAYESVNAKEYWASLTMWYFGSHGEFLPTRRPEKFPAPGPEGLKAYDPEGFALVDRLYNGGK